MGEPAGNHTLPLRGWSLLLMTELLYCMVISLPSSKSQVAVVVGSLESVC